MCAFTAVCACVFGGGGGGGTVVGRGEGGGPDLCASRWGCPVPCLCVRAPVVRWGAVQWMGQGSERSGKPRGAAHSLTPVAFGRAPCVRVCWCTPLCGTGCEQPFVAFSGYAFARQWFFRVEGSGSKSAAAPTTALLLELRQRQMVAVLSEGAEFHSPLHSPTGSGSGSARYAKVDFDAIDSLYEAGMAGPVCGPLLRLFLAQYMRVYCHNRHLELSQLRVLQHMSCPFDVAFFVHQRLREVKLEEKASSAKGNVSIETHVKFDVLKARADRQVWSRTASVP
jgi:hypothetical protein